MSKLLAWLVPLGPIRLTPNAVYWLPTVRPASYLPSAVICGPGMAAPQVVWDPTPHPYGMVVLPWGDEAYQQVAVNKYGVYTITWRGPASE